MNNVLSDAMDCLRWAAFFDAQNCNRYQHELNLLIDLNKAVAERTLLIVRK